MRSGHVGDRALVLGGSMAGLLAARVLAEAFAEVVIVDRDRLTGVRAPRRGVPHGAHAHGLLARGQQILEELFPGFTDDVIAAGLGTADLGELRWFFHGRRLQPARTGLICIIAARPELECQVRQRVATLTNVTFIEECAIAGLLSTPDRTRISGARVRRQDLPEEELEADLVVDATGRGSRTPAWLEELGYGRPHEDRVKIDLSYASRRYRLPDDAVLGGDAAIIPAVSPALPRGGFFLDIGHGQYMVSLCGALGDHPPADSDAFTDWSKTLSVPDIHDVVQAAHPLDDPVTFRFPTSVRRRYEKLDRFPERLLVMGDAAASFSPIYAQGMTVAAQESLILRDQLRHGLPRPRPFHKAIARVIKPAWDISAGGDLTHPAAQGRRTPKIRIVNAYITRLQLAAAQDGRVTEAFMRVSGLVDPPPTLMRPGLALRVLWKGKA